LYNPIMRALITDISGRGNGILYIIRFYQRRVVRDDE
jgi:hypothetical protein